MSIKYKTIRNNVFNPTNAETKLSIRLENDSLNFAINHIDFPKLPSEKLLLKITSNSTAIRMEFRYIIMIYVL